MFCSCLLKNSFPLGTQAQEQSCSHSLESCRPDRAEIKGNKRRKTNTLVAKRENSVNVQPALPDPKQSSSSLENVHEAQRRHASRSPKPIDPSNLSKAEGVSAALPARAEPPKLRTAVARGGGEWMRARGGRRRKDTCYAARRGPGRLGAPGAN